jgi:hypothetical protein
MSERNDLANRRQDIAQKLRRLIAAWEREVDAEAEINVPGLANPTSGVGGAGRGAAPQPRK